MLTLGGWQSTSVAGHMAPDKHPLYRTYKNE